MRYGRMVLVTAALSGMLSSASALAAGGSHLLSGVVGSIDPAARTLMVRADAGSGGKDTKFSLAPGVQIQAGAKAERLEDLKSGDKVTISYKERADGTHMAESITVARATSTAPRTNAGRGSAASTRAK